MYNRSETKTVRVGNILIGGDNPISVQSMTNVPAGDYENSIKQIMQLEKAGCDIVRLAVPKAEYAEVFTLAKKAGVMCPLVADIHFDYKIAVECTKHDVDKIRINPGNIGEKWKVREVVEACKDKGIPIRIGVNSGSLSKELLDKYSHPCAEALAESALSEAECLEDCGFSDIVISIKSSNVAEMIKASSIVRGNSHYPIHLGVTEAGDDYSGLVKNSIGIGSLLIDGIGDTIRVSLTADPIEEVRAGIEILSAIGMNKRGRVNVISCPTCGRTKINLIGLVKEYKKRIVEIDTHGKHLNVALMGCVVNGPGEAKEADFGIAGGDGFYMFFKDGQPIKRLDENEALDFLIDETKKALGEKKN